MLKKLSAIILLALFLFNIAGYRMFFFYAERNADQRLETIIDSSQYDQEQLITVTVPLNMPYFSGTKFERVSGEMKLNGHIYKYVSRRIENDSLILQCLPDRSRTELASAKSGFEANVLDLQPTASGKKIPTSSHKAFPDADYLFHYNTLVSRIIPSCIVSQNGAPGGSPVHGNPKSIFQPPDFSAALLNS